MGIYENGGDYMEYLTAKEAGENWNITARMVNYYCSAGRLQGAVKKGDLWLIPNDVEKPADERYKATKTKNDDLRKNEIYRV